MSSFLVKLPLICLLVLFSSSTEAKKSRATQIFACDDDFNNQIKMELEAAQVYLSLATHFNHDSVALKGFGKYFIHSWKEELEHAQQLIDYVLMRGGNVVVPAVLRPENDTKWDSMNVCEIMNNVLGLEMLINEHLHKVHKCGDEKEDPQMQDFLEANFLKHHMEVNKELADMITRIERATTYKNANGQSISSCDGLGLHLFDHELSK